MTDQAQPSAWGTEVPAWEPEVPPWAPGTHGTGTHSTGTHGTGAHSAGAYNAGTQGAGTQGAGAQGAPWAPGVAFPRGLQEHHEGRPLGQPLPAEPALMTDSTPRGVSPVTGETASGGQGGSGGDQPGPDGPDGPDGGNDAGFRGGRRPGPGRDQAGSAGPEKAVTAAPGPSRDDRWAMACYLGAIFFWLLAPLVIYLAKRNRSIFIRSHAAQAFNLTLTATLFAVSGAIIGGLLALDSPKAALVIMGPVLLVFWIVVLTYLVRAASSASRNDFYEIPGWLCVTALR